MKPVLSVLLLVIVQIAGAQTFSARETWSGIGVGVNSDGMLVGNSCSEHWRYGNDRGIEFPVGSNIHFTYGGFWFGALIHRNGALTPRVSAGFARNGNYEMMSRNGIVESAHLDTSYIADGCIHEPLTDYYSRSDHEFATTIYDSLENGFSYPSDPTDGRHYPLGLKIDMTTYAFRDFCSRVVWVRLRVTNVGLYNLRDLWFGNYSVTVAALGDSLWNNLHGAVGFEHENEFSYYFSQTGRADSSGDEVVSSSAAGIVPLIDRSYQSVGFNWWVQDILDFGPAWVSYAERDSLWMAWTRLKGSPDDDLQRYQLMTNHEQDYDPLRAFDTTWVAEHTPPDQSWSPSSIDPVTFRDLLQNPQEALLSSGPYGRLFNGHYWLMQGDSVDVWFAVFGGQGFHNPSRPQPADSVDPDLYDVTDLLDRADVAKNSPCFSWLDVEDPRLPVTADEFELMTPYPNPFNGEVRIEYRAPAAANVEVDLVNVLGQRVKTLFDGKVDGSRQVLTWRPDDAATGVYFVRLLSDKSVVGMQKLMYVK